MKLHLAHRYSNNYIGTPVAIMFCGYEAQGLSADFTTDIATIEALPRAKICLSCLKAHKSRRTTPKGANDED